MKIHKGNLLIALNHDVVSFKLADLFVDENKDTASKVKLFYRKLLKFSSFEKQLD